MASLSEAAEGLFKKGKRKSASSIQVECARHDKQDDHKQLNQLLDILLDPRKPISDSENLDWLKWLIAGGKSPEEFAQSGKYLHQPLASSVLTLELQSKITTTQLLVD